LELHWSFFLILAWFIGLGVKLGHSAASLAAALGLFAAAAICLIMHEFGHVLAARRFGIATRAVTLTGIGAVSRLERSPQTPREEWVIAAAGPALTIALIVLCAVAVFATEGEHAMWAITKPGYVPFAGF